MDHCTTKEELKQNVMISFILFLFFCRILATLLIRVYYLLFFIERARAFANPGFGLRASLQLHFCLAYLVFGVGMDTGDLATRRFGFTLEAFLQILLLRLFRDFSSA